MLPNQASFDGLELQAIFGATNCVEFDNIKSCSGVSIDTREVKDQDIFVALVGEKSDAHNRINEAFDKGAIACVVNRDWRESHRDEFIGKPFIIVNDTLKALGELAKHYRKRFNIPMIAIGGANGKTTTKEMTSFLLSKKYNILKTHENFNNQLGLPLMLLQLNDSHQLAVLEIGTNEPGEIFTLANIMQPTHGLITNIGKEHLEKLIDLDGVEMEEPALYAYLAKNGGKCLVNYDDERLKKYVKVIENGFLFGADKKTHLKANISMNDNLNPIIDLELDGQKVIINMKTIGRTTALNAIAASSVALQFGFTLHDLKNYLEEYENQIGHKYARMLLESVGDISIINDCYNANPESMKAALATLKEMKRDGKKIAVIGDMRELGDVAKNEHEEILKIASESADKILLLGDIFSEADKKLKIPNTQAFNTQDELFNDLAQMINANDLILVKGSRGLKMELIIEMIKAKYQ